MIHEEIRALYDTVVTIIGEDALDKDGKKVTIDETKVNIKIKELQSAYDKLAYQRKRAFEYPSFADQLDDIYHNGIDGWKKTIKAIKDKYPKE